jgi:lysozyme
MRTSETMQEMIRNFEGLCLKAMRCPAGVLTIGYGHTGSDVKEGMTITKSRANEILSSDLSKFETSLNNMLTAAKVTLKQNQFDALISFVFNLGVGTLQRSTLWRKLKANPNDTTIPNEFRRYVYAAGKVLPGLVKRRDAEAKYYAK